MTTDPANDAAAVAAAVAASDAAPDEAVDSDDFFCASFDSGGTGTIQIFSKVSFVSRGNVVVGN